VSAGVAARVDLRLGSLHLDVDVEVPARSVTAVLGPNGAGKTTLLRAVAGFVTPAAGRVSLAGRVVSEPPRLDEPPEHRRVGMVHQDYLLFPHLSVLENVAFGPRSRGEPAREARRLAAERLAAMGLEREVRARPGALSGGQQQRVALARALATDPVALLLDEPLAALDVRSRPALRRELRDHLAAYSGATLLVTHDVADVLDLADHVVVLEGGRVTHRGPVADVLTRPRTDYVVDLAATASRHS
jgi:molybdate transport system ATP-binding protein